MSWPHHPLAPRIRTPSSQTSAVKTFVDRFLKDGTGATNIALKPATSKFDLDYSKVIDWATPTLQ